MTDRTHDLAALRTAAQQRDPEQTQFLLKKIFLSMDFYAVLEIAVTGVHEYAPTFEAQHPKATWPRELLTQMVAFGVAPERLPEEAVRDFATPGSANFIKAIFDIAHALQRKTAPQAKIGYLVSAIVNTIMARVVYEWYSEHADAWDIISRSHIEPETGMYDDPNATQIAYQFWTDDATARRDINGWLQIIEQIEKKLES
ncbi:MAG: hypothetical protein D6737_19375 [Chloroflexi bacterium]|nr:MAG: hypothetical protein D6737_19375 [Chloroflexota bacterium]